MQIFMWIQEQTRNTQRAQTTTKRQHNRIAEWFLQCKLAMQLWSGSSPKFIRLVPGPCPTPPRNFVKICSQLFQLSDRQTDRQTDRSENITSFFGGGNLYASNVMYGALTILLNKCSYVVAILTGHSRHTDHKTFEDRTTIFLISSIRSMLKPANHSGQSALAENWH